MPIEISGTTGISGVDGSASAPALQGSDSNTGVSFGTDTVNINTGGSTRATVDSSGNLNISNGELDVNKSGTGDLFHVQGNGTGAVVAKIENAYNSDNDRFAILELKSGKGSIRFNSNSDSNEGAITYEMATNAMIFGTNNATERMRLESSGNLVWTGASTQYVQMTHSGDVMIVQTQGTSAGNHGMIQFRDGGGTYCGQITSHGTNHTTSYVTNSDYRLKQNEASISDGITRLKQLKPYRFEWKSSGNEVDGFFAHEAQAVVPESVIGTKDEVDSDNKPVYQGIDQAKLVPLLTAALQEAVAKIEVLETKVAALEAG